MAAQRHESTGWGGKHLQALAPNEEDKQPAPGLVGVKFEHNWGPARQLAAAQMKESLSMSSELNWIAGSAEINFSR